MIPKLSCAARPGRPRPWRPDGVRPLSRKLPTSQRFNALPPRNRHVSQAADKLGWQSPNAARHVPNPPTYSPTVPARFLRFSGGLKLPTLRSTSRHRQPGTADPRGQSCCNEGETVEQDVTEYRCRTCVHSALIRRTSRHSLSDVGYSVLAPAPPSKEPSNDPTILPA